MPQIDIGNTDTPNEVKLRSNSVMGESKTLNPPPIKHKPPLKMTGKKRFTLLNPTPMPGLIPDGQN
jgi:hypothetical protein